MLDSRKCKYCTERTSIAVEFQQDQAVCKRWQVQHRLCQRAATPQGCKGLLLEINIDETNAVAADVGHSRIEKLNKMCRTDVYYLKFIIQHHFSYALCKYGILGIIFRFCKEHTMSYERKT